MVSFTPVYGLHNGNGSRTIVAEYWQCLPNHMSSTSKNVLQHTLAPSHKQMQNVCSNGMAKKVLFSEAHIQAYAEFM
jgi:hypothetical protein